MSWYYNSVTGVVSEATGFAKWVKDRAIFAERHDPIPGQIDYGPFATREDAEAFKVTHPATGIIADVHETAHTATQLPAIIEGYLVRVAEMTVGIVLLAIALNAIVKHTTGVDVANSTRKGVAKVKGAAAKTGTAVAAAA